VSPLQGPDDPKKKKPPQPVVAEEPFDVDAFEAEAGQQPVAVEEEPFDVDAFEAEGNVAQATFEPVETRPERARVNLNLGQPVQDHSPIQRAIQGTPRLSERIPTDKPGTLGTLSAMASEVATQNENAVRGGAKAWFGAPVEVQGMLRRITDAAKATEAQPDGLEFGFGDYRLRPGRTLPAVGKALEEVAPTEESLAGQEKVVEGVFQPEGPAGKAGEVLGGFATVAAEYGMVGRATRGLMGEGSFLARLAAQGPLGTATANALVVAPADVAFGVADPYPSFVERFGEVGGRAASAGVNVLANVAAEYGLHAAADITGRKARNARDYGDMRRVGESLDDLGRIEASMKVQESAVMQGRSDLSNALEEMLNRKRAEELAARQAQEAAQAAVQNEPPSPMGSLLRGADEELLEGQRGAAARRGNAAEEAAKAAEAEQAREALANAIRGFHEAGGVAPVEGAATPFQRNYESIFAKADEVLPAEPPGEPPADAGGAAEAEPPAWDAHMTPIEREDLRTRVQSEPRLTDFDDDDILDARMRQKDQVPVDYSQTPEGLEKRQANVETLLDNRGEAEFGGELGDIPGRAEAPHRAGEVPELHILTGSPGSGKSTIVKGLIQDEGMLGATLVDTDEGKKLIEGFDEGRGANLVHKESQAHWRELMDRGQAEGRDLIMPTVGTNQAVLEGIIQRAKQRGYEVFLHHVDIPKAEAGKRAVARFRDRTGKLARFVDPHYVVNVVGDAPREVHGRVKRLPELSGTRHLDNMVPRGSKPNVIEGTGRYAPTGGEAAELRAGGGTLDEGLGGAGAGGVGEGGADATGLPAPAAPEPAAPQAPRPRIRGVEGPESRVTLADGTKYPVTFRIVEAGDLQPSHNAQTFEPNPVYPKGVQGRRYHADRAAQENVVEAATKLDADLLLNDTGTAEGTPIVTGGGTVLSGNQRTMTLQRAAAVDIAEPGNRFEMYVDALRERLESLGLPEDALDQFENPVLVREVSAEHVDPTNPEAMQAFNAASDVATGKAKSAIDEGMTRATKLMRAEDAISFFSETMGDETLRAYLDGPRGKQFLDALVRDGVVSRAELGRLVQDGKLTPEAKQLLERTMYAAAVGDPDVLERIPGKIKQKLDTAVPAIVRANAIEGYSLQEPLQSALRELANVSEAGAGISSLADLRAQASMFGDDPLVMAGRGLADYLEANPKAKVTEAFQRYANGAKEATAHGGADDIFGTPPETPEQLVARAFGRPPEEGKGLGRAGYIGVRDKPLPERTWQEEVTALRADGEHEAADALASFMEGSERDTPVFHGTVYSFDDFIYHQDDVGHHTGNADQANDRLAILHTADPANHAAGGQLMPLWVRGKYAEVTDFGSWEADRVASELLADKTITTEQYQRIVQTGGRSQQFRVLRWTLKENGYSGVKYRNAFEGGASQEWRANNEYKRKTGQPEMTRQEFMEAAYPGKSLLQEGAGDQNFSYAVFEPGDLKSATGNRGTFNPGVPDVRGASGVGGMAGMVLGGGAGFAAGSQVGDTPEERLRNGLLAGLAGLTLGGGLGLTAGGKGTGRGILGLEGLERGAMGERRVPLPGRSWQDHAAGLERAGHPEAAANLTRFMGNSKVPKVVFHGTTHDFNAFDPTRANIENNWGQGIYFTDAPLDMMANYARVGPDLTQRIEMTAEQLQWDETMTAEEARSRARKQLVGPHEGAAMPAYINLENPAIVGGADETRLTLEEHFDAEGEWDGEEPTGSLIGFIESLQDNAERFGVQHGDMLSVVERLYGEAAGGDGLTVREAQKIVQNSDELLDATDDNGAIASSELVRLALEHVGFDGVIDRTVYDKFGPPKRGLFKGVGGMQGLEPTTTHYVAFKPEQIKSATGNRGTFSPDVTDVTGAIGDQPRKGPREQPELQEGGESDGGDEPTWEEIQDRMGQPRVHDSPEGFSYYIGNNLSGLEHHLKQADELDRTGRVTYEAYDDPDDPEYSRPAREADEGETDYLRQVLPQRTRSARHHIKQLVREFREKHPQEPVPHADRLRAQGFEVPEPGALSLFDEAPEQPRSRYEVDEDATGYDPVNEPDDYELLPFEVEREKMLQSGDGWERVRAMRDKAQRWDSPAWDTPEGAEAHAQVRREQLKLSQAEREARGHDRSAELRDARADMDLKYNEQYGGASPRFLPAQERYRAAIMAFNEEGPTTGRYVYADDGGTLRFFEKEDLLDTMQQLADARAISDVLPSSDPGRDSPGYAKAMKAWVKANNASMSTLPRKIDHMLGAHPELREAIQGWKPGVKPEAGPDLFAQGPEAQGITPSHTEWLRQRPPAPAPKGMLGLEDMAAPEGPALSRLEETDAVYKARAAEYEEARVKYHDQEIGDEEFLAARQARDEALAAWEEAEAEASMPALLRSAKAETAKPTHTVVQEGPASWGVKQPDGQTVRSGLLTKGGAEEIAASLDHERPTPRAPRYELFPEEKAARDVEREAQQALKMDTSPVRGPQGMKDALRRANLIVNDPKQAFLAKNGRATQVYKDAQALLARGEKIGTSELGHRLEELRGEEKRETPKDDGTLTLFANPIPQVLQGIASHRLPSTAVLATTGALLSDSDDPNIQKIGHFTVALAALHGIGMKRISAAGGAAGRTMVRSMMRHDAGKATLRFLHPEALLSPEVKEAIKAFELLRSKGKAIRGQWEKKAQALGPVGDRVVSDLIELEDHGEGGQLNPADMQATLDVAAGIAAEWEQIGDLKVQSEVLPQHAVDAHRGTYAGPRLYAEFEALDALGQKVAPGQPRKVRIQDQKRRTLGSDLESMVTRSELGEIRESSARLRGLEKGYADVAAAKLFQSLRSIPGVVHPDFKMALDDFLAARSMWQQAKAVKDVAGQQIAEGMMQQSKSDMDAITRQFSTGQGDYVSMPDGKGMGVLRGMVVTKEVANSLNGLPDLRFTGPFMRFWKAKTTIFNPGTHVGNVMSNVTMLHMAGVPAWKQPVLLRGAAKDMASYGPATQALAEAGVLDVNVVTANTEGAAGTVRATRKELLRQLKTGKKQATDVLEELGLKETTWDRIKALGEKIRGPLARLYNNEDNIFRVAYAQHASTPVSRGGLGMSMDEAVEASRKDLIDFRTRSPAIRLLGGSIAPFILYPAKAIPTFARHVIEHPWRYLGLVAAWTALDKHSQEKVGPIDQLDLPPDQRRGWAGTALPGLTQVPFEGPSGAKGAFDIARWTPLSGLTDASPPGSATSVAFDNWPRLLSPSGPLTDIGARLANTDPYTGQKLVPRSATPGEFGEVVAEGAADLLLPPALGFHRRRLTEDIQSGDRAAVANDAAGLVGLRPRYVRPGQYQQRAQYELEQALMDAKQRLRQGLRKSQRPERDEDLYDEYENRARRAQERYIDRTTAE